MRNVGVKNESEEEVLRQAMTLRSSAGRSTHVKVKERHVQPSQGGQRASPSVQVDLSCPGACRTVQHVLIFSGAMECGRSRDYISIVLVLPL